MSCSIGLIKLTIDNVFNPKKDMGRIIDLIAFWFLGLAIGTALSGILSNPNDKILPSN